MQAYGGELNDAEQFVKFDNARIKVASAEYSEEGVSEHFVVDDDVVITDLEIGEKTATCTVTNNTDHYLSSVYIGIAAFDAEYGLYTIDADDYYSSFYSWPGKLYAEAVGMKPGASQEVTFENTNLTTLGDTLEDNVFDTENYIIVKYVVDIEKESSSD